MGVKLIDLELLFRSNARQATADVNGLTQSITGLKGKGADIDSTGNKMQQMGDKTQAGAMGAIKGLIGVAGSITALVATSKQLYEFAQAGSQLERVAEAGSSLARTFGADMDFILKKLRSASMGTIAESDLIGSANKAMMLGLGADADQLSNLLEVALFRAKAMGLSATQAFDDIVRGIGRTSPLILDNLGIVFDAEELYTNYAKSIGRTKDSLTDAEKKTALLNETLKIGNEMMAEAGGLTRDTATAYEQLASSAKNAGDSLKKNLGNWFEPFIISLNLGLFGDQVKEAFSGLMDLVNQDVPKTYGEYIGQALLAGINSGAIKDKYKDVISNALLYQQDEIGAFLSQYGSREWGLYGNKVKYENEYGISKWEKLSPEQVETAKMIQDLNQFSYSLGRGSIDSLQELLSVLNLISEVEFDNIAQTQALFANMASQGILSAPGGGAWTADDPRGGLGWTAPETVTTSTMDELGTLMSGSLGSSTDDFIEKQGELKDKMADVNAEIEKMKKWGYSEQGSKITGLRDDYGKLADQYEKNATEHEESTRRIVFGIMEQQALASGYANDQLFWDLAKNWGLIDEATYNAQLASTNLFSALENGTEIAISWLETLGMTIEDLPAEARTTVYVDTIYSETGEGFQLTGKGGGQNDGGLEHNREAFGGSFMVPPGYPNDSYLYQAWVQSGEKITVTPGGNARSEGDAGNNVVIEAGAVVVNNPPANFDAYKLTELIAQEIMKRR